MIFKKARAYNTSIFRFNKAKQKELKAIVILILNEISIVKAKLLNFVLLVFRQLKSNSLLFRGLNIIVLRDLL